MKTLNPKYIRLTPDSRLYNLDVPIIGLTGGIATGKSTVSRIMVANGIPLIDADQLVKSIYSKPATCDYIKQHHPETWKDGAIHFPTLREKFFKDLTIKQNIETFIYGRLPQSFLDAYKLLGNPSYVVYDVPLLFEKQLQEKVDLSVLVYAPRESQVNRIMARDGHTIEMAEVILKHQLEIEEKKKKADFIIDNSAGIEELAAKVQNFLRQVLV